MTWSLIKLMVGVLPLDCEHSTRILLQAAHLLVHLKDPEYFKRVNHFHEQPVLKLHVFFAYISNPIFNLRAARYNYLLAHTSKDKTETIAAVRTARIGGRRHDFFLYFLNAKLKYEYISASTQYYTYGS